MTPDSYTPNRLRSDRPVPSPRPSYRGVVLLLAFLGFLGFLGLLAFFHFTLVQ